MRNSSSGHVCHSPQHTSSPVYVSSSRTMGTGEGCPITGLAGESMYMFPLFHLLNKVIQKLQKTETCEVILIVPWWPSQPWFPHRLRLCVEHSRFFPYRRDLLSQQGYISSGKSYHQHAWRFLCSTIKQQEEVSKLAAAPRRPSTNRMYDNRWLHFANWATGKGFDPLGPTAAQIAVFCMNFLILMACHLRLSKDTGP